jgi:hypothetical protein
LSPKLIHVYAIVPGESAAWCCLTVPRLSIFGTEPSEITARDYGEFHGEEAAQADSMARLAREIQSLDYKIGPAIIIGDDDDTPAVRLAAILSYLSYSGKLGDSTITVQDWTEADKVTDKVLSSRHLLTGSPSINDAHRQAIATLRRARTDAEFAGLLWPTGHIE